MAKALRTLLIGDVGSGKTIVSLSIILGFINSLSTGFACIMVPTSVLAKQHYENALELLKKDKNIALLLNIHNHYYYNGQKIKKDKLKELSQKYQIWIGTQALLFNNTMSWDFVVVDEQHRFGVKQRRKLIDISQKAHYLSLSATPIPRSLALSLYSELDVKYLDQFRPKNIKTIIIQRENWLNKVKSKLNTALSNNEKVYVITSKVEEGDDDLMSLNEVYNILRNEYGKKVQKVSGKEKQKESILHNFASSKELSILVSTTVVEVGVDIPEATTIVIIDADRFGLATLHQLRGRVGRNIKKQNECILVTRYPKISRLEILTETLDGYKIAEFDMQIRGAGSIYGVEQSGIDKDLETLMKLKSQDIATLKSIVENMDYSLLSKNYPRLDFYLKQNFDHTLID